LELPYLNFIKIRVVVNVIPAIFARIIGSEFGWIPYKNQSDIPTEIRINMNYDRSFRCFVL